MSLDVAELWPRQCRREARPEEQAHAFNGWVAKKRYTKAHAKLTAQTFGGSTMRAYPCDACGHWHVGRIRTARPADTPRA